LTATDHPALMSIGIFLAYMVLVGSRAHVLRGIVLPIGLGALQLAVVTTWLG